MKGILSALMLIGVMAMVQNCTSMLTSITKPTVAENTEQKQAQPEATPVVMTAAEKAANDAAWEAKQAEIAAKQKADAEAAKFNICTKIDQGGVKTVDLVAAQEALSLCPWNTEAVNAQIDIKQFSDTLQKHTPGLFASETMDILAPEIYKQRDAMYAAINGISIDQGEYLVSQVLEQQSASHGLGWSDKKIANLSKGIVAGLYDWNN
jgi:hypothetical protein